MMEDPVYLAMLTDECEADDDSIDYGTNKLGGVPDLPCAIGACDSTALPTAPRCGRCGALMYFLLQMYCPLGGSRYHRTLYLFVCLEEAGADGAACQADPAGWRLLRVQVAAAATESAATAPTVAPAASWNHDADEWSDEEEPQQPAVHQALPPVHVGTTQQQQQRIVSRKWSSISNTLCPVARHLEVFDEAECVVQAEDDVTTRFAHLLKEAAAEPDTACVVTESAEDDEASAYGSRLYAKFLRQLARCPQQAVRYAWAGRPLCVRALSDAEQHRAVTSRCPRCSAPRCFELQLMPGLLSATAADQQCARLLFDTLLIFSCSASCWPEDAGGGNGGQQLLLEEVVIPQTDPDA